MCLAVPVLVSELHDNQIATVKAGGLSKKISTVLLDEVKVGDYVLLHVGYALHLVSEEEALSTLALMAEAGMLEEAMVEMAQDHTR